MAKHAEMAKEMGWGMAWLVMAAAFALCAPIWAGNVCTWQGATWC